MNNVNIINKLLMIVHYETIIFLLGMEIETIGLEEEYSRKEPKDSYYGNII